MKNGNWMRTGAHLTGAMTVERTLPVPLNVFVVSLVQFSLPRCIPFSGRDRAVCRHRRICGYE